jgi:hypothetical protein
MAVIKIVPMPGAVGDKGDEGAPGPQGQQGPAGQNGLPGTPALWSYQGAWQSNAAYVTGDIVTYQGQLYYTKSVTTAGTLPTVTAKFDLIASKGADGTNGTNGINGADGSPGLVYLGDYVSGNGYIANIAVVKGADDNLYIAKASGGLLSPVANPGQWDLFLPKGANGADGATPFTLIGAYDNGASYNLGIAVYYNGGTYVRTGNPLNPGYPPEVGAINASWTPIAEKGADSIAPTSGTWGHDFFEESGLTTETYDTVADYYKVGELVYFDLNVNLGYVTDWGQTQVDPPLWHSWSFKLPYNARGVTGAHNVVFTGMIYDTSLAEEVSERTSNDQGFNPIFGKIINVGGESRVYLYSIVNSEFAGYAPGELRNLTSTFPKDFTQPANIQTGLNASRLRISGTYRSE